MTMSTPEVPSIADNPSKAPDNLPVTSNNHTNRYKMLGIILGVFLVLGLAGFFWWLHSAGFEETDDAYITGHIHPVSARISGTVIEVKAEDNQQVHSNQLLVRIDPKDYKIALDQAVHNLAVAQVQAKTAQANIPLTQQQTSAQITQAQAGIGVAQSNVIQSQKAAQEAQAGINSAEQAAREQQANYQKALLDYRRYAGADPEAISAQQLDTARTSLKVAEANRAAALSQVTQARARAAQAKAGISTSTGKISEARGTFQGAQAQRLQLNIAKSQAKSAEAAIATAQDAVAQAKLNLAYTHVLAPINGMIGRRTVEIGQQAQAGEPLLSIVSPNPWVIANFKETQLKRIRPGQTVRISVDAYPDHEFTGYVDSFSPASGAQFALLPPENATGNFTKTVQRVPVKIVLDTKSVEGYEKLLVPGLSVVPRIDVRSKARHDVAQAGER